MCSLPIHLVGVDDDTVCKYDRALLKTYQSLYTSNEDHQAIRFRGLTDILFSNSDAEASFRRDWFYGLSIEHPICSQRSDDAELARMIMMSGFQTSKEHFRKLIADQHEHALKLYRGQARFMQDDLSCPKFLAMSTKHKKKISFAVAAEMIARNQAYSNLLELLLPNYVRLSIHAHSNRGPKFGIRLFPRTKVRAIESIIDRHAICPSYEFQVPTPWHNSMIKIEGEDMLYLGKAEIVHKALEAGDFEGEWINDRMLGGHFALRPMPVTSTTCSVINESISTLSTKFDDEKKTMSARIDDFGLSPTNSIINTTKVRLAIRLHGKIHRMLGFSKLFAKPITTDDLSFQELQTPSRKAVVVSR
jgi:pyoverdine/dityrosine biosynthesis protein Dit1